MCILSIVEIVMLVIYFGPCIRSSCYPLSSVFKTLRLRVPDIRASDVCYHRRPAVDNISVPRRLHAKLHISFIESALLIRAQSFNHSRTLKICP